MLKLNAGFSRKVGEPNFSSRGASVNVELELESHLIGDPAALLDRIQNLFELARQAVDAELSDAPADARPRIPKSNGNGERGATPYARRTANGQADSPTRYATVSQVRAIRAICKRQDVDPLQLANGRYGVNDLEELTLQEASALIDELKSAPAGGNGQKGGRR
jgi:hypothetical protein